MGIFQKITSSLILLVLENHIVTNLLLDGIYHHLAFLILRSFPFWSHHQGIIEFLKIYAVDMELSHKQILFPKSFAETSTLGQHRASTGLTGYVFWGPVSQ